MSLKMTLQRRIRQWMLSSRAALKLNQIMVLEARASPQIQHHHQTKSNRANSNLRPQQITRTKAVLRCRQGLPRDIIFHPKSTRNRLIKKMDSAIAEATRAIISIPSLHHMIRATQVVVVTQATIRSRMKSSRKRLWLLHASLIVLVSKSWRAACASYDQTTKNPGYES